MTTQASRTSLMLALLALALPAASGCRSESSPASAAMTAPPPAASLSGRITIDGSSTLLPVSNGIADAFQKTAPGVQVIRQASGTGAGLKRFCAAEIDIAAASRPINADESRQCQDKHIAFIELPVAFDSLTVVVNAANTFVTCLTAAELRRIWEPGAQGKVTHWNQVRSTFPAEPLTLFGPGTESGTFDYFTLAIVGTERSSRTDYTKSEDDQVLVNGIAADTHALGYFGYDYYQANQDKLRAVAIDDGHGCIAPGPETVADATYQPLSRPMFLYVSTKSAERPAVKAFAHFYVDPDNAPVVKTAGAVPLRWE